MAQIPGPGAEEAPLAFYLPPTVDGSRPGTYFVNTTEPATRTRYESEALAFHESIPGHHLQIAIAQELEGIPEFRKTSLVTAYVEGWGLYTERLADEMGLYSGDLERMGILSFDSWRAGRLVVDTGMHVLGWSRDEAVEYLIMNSPQAPNNIETEVDRYIGWPGQAVAYKLGQRDLPVARRRTAATRAGLRHQGLPRCGAGLRTGAAAGSGGAGRSLAAGGPRMISIDLARRLRDAGLEWHPADGDRFYIPDRDLDEHTFSISEMTVDVRHVQGGRQIAFNGAVEWALDAIMEHEVIWLPAESQLRVLLGDTFVGLQRDASGYHCTTGNDLTFSAPVAADAYGLALLDHLNTQSGSAGTGL